LQKLSQGTGIGYEALMQVTGLLPPTKSLKEQSDSTTLQILDIIGQLDNHHKEMALGILRVIRREQEKLGKKKD
jgi:hypothetical protein